MKIVEFKNVTRTFGKDESLTYAVNDVSFSIEEGEFVVILGPSGAGKSTVLNMLGGMDQPSFGEVIIDGLHLKDLNDRQLSDYRADKIGFIFQFYNLIASMTVLENVSVTKQIVKKARDAKEMLKLVGLEKHYNKFPSQLSGGEQQRVSIARALAKNPKIILGDEPTGALDSKSGQDVLVLLQKLNQSEKKTIILVTHNSDIAKCANTVIYMKNGRVVKVVHNDNPLDARKVEW